MNFCRAKMVFVDDEMLRIAKYVLFCHVSAVQKILRRLRLLSKVSRRNQAPSAQTYNYKT